MAIYYPEYRPASCGGAVSVVSAVYGGADRLAKVAFPIKKSNNHVGVIYRGLEPPKILNVIIYRLASSKEVLALIIGRAGYSNLNARHDNQEEYALTQ